MKVAQEFLGLTRILVGFYQHSTQKHGCAFGSRISQESCLGITRTYYDFTRILLAFNSEAWLCVWLEDFLGKLLRNYQDLLRFYQDFTSIQLRSMVVRLARGFPRKVAQELLGLTMILPGFYQHSTQKHGCAFDYRISQESCLGITRTYQDFTRILVAFNSEALLCVWLQDFLGKLPMKYQDLL